MNTETKPQTDPEKARAESLDADLRTVTCDRYPAYPVTDATGPVHFHGSYQKWPCSGRLTGAITPGADQ